MVEVGRDVLPTAGVVALRAVLPKPARVWIDLQHRRFHWRRTCVACCAGGICCAVFAARGMTSAAAICTQRVFTEQREIRGFMIERVRIKRHNAATAAFVLGVALHTVVGVFDRVWIASMQAGARFYIHCDLFMAAHTKRGLALAFKRHVAVITVIF